MRIQFVSDLHLARTLLRFYPQGCERKQSEDEDRTDSSCTNATMYRKRIPGKRNQWRIYGGVGQLYCGFGYRLLDLWSLASQYQRANRQNEDPLQPTRLHLAWRVSAQWI